MVRIVTNGGKGTGVNPRGTDYPFVAPSDDLAGLIADAYLAHEDPVTLPLRVSWVRGLDAAFYGASSSSASAESASSGSESGHAVDVVIKDAADQVVFDSAEADDYRAADFGDRLRIHEWQTDIAVCRIVQHTAFHQLEDVRVIPAELEPENGTLDARVNEEMPARVTSLRVGVNVIDEHIVLRSGYNVSLAAENPAINGLRNVQQVTLAAVPGSGLGRFNNCEAQDLFVKKINQVSPTTQGDFLLAATDCYWVRQPATVVTGPPREVFPAAATLRVGSDCDPCCDCEDFIRVYKGVRRVRDQFAAIGADAEETRDTYHSNRERWLAAKECVEDNVARIVTFPHLNFIEVGVAICNLSQSCVTDIEAELEVEVNCEGDSPVPELVPCTTLKTNVRNKWEYYEMSTSPSEPASSASAATGGPPWYAYWDALSPGFSAKLRARLEFPPGMDCSVTFRVKGWIEGELVGEAEETTRLVECDV